MYIEVVSVYSRQGGNIVESILAKAENGSWEVILSNSDLSSKPAIFSQDVQVSFSIFLALNRKYSSPRGVRLKCYYAFFLVCCGFDTSYIVSVHFQCQDSIYILYTFVVSRAFLAGAASQAGDAGSSRAPGLTFLQGSMNVYCWCHSDSASVLLYFTCFCYKCQIHTDCPQAHMMQKRRRLHEWIQYISIDEVLTCYSVWQSKVTSQTHDISHWNCCEPRNIPIIWSETRCYLRIECLILSVYWSINVRWRVTNCVNLRSVAEHNVFFSCLFVCLSVCLFVCLSVVNFNFRYNFWTVRYRDFIFGMHTSRMSPL